jgi:hypothetical protein
MKSSIVLEEREYINDKQIWDWFGVDRKTWKRWSDEGRVPKPVLLGTRRYYDRREVETRILSTAR